MYQSNAASSQYRIGGFDGTDESKARMFGISLESDFDGTESRDQELSNYQ